jgi:hypothetical protein
MTTQQTQRRRWDIDEVGHGIASGQAFAPQVARLFQALREADWVAEQPDVHLLPHIRRACEAPGSPWRLLRSDVQNAVLDVELRWERPNDDLATVRGDALALIGTFAEASTHIRQRWTGTTLEYDVATGMLNGDAEFEAHGHLVTLRVHGPRVTEHA